MSPTLEVDLAVALGTGGFSLEAAFVATAGTADPAGGARDPAGGARDPAQGEVLAVLGPNGAGKSTLLRALAGLVPIDAGHVRLDGQTLEDAGTGERLLPERRPIGVVFQDHLLFPHLDVVDNVAFGLRVRGVGRRAARQGARRWLDRMGLGHRAGASTRHLSGGEAQRVALARALATDPLLLLLDEPLAALDVRTRSEVRREMGRHLATFAGIRILVTHDPLDALALADRLLILEEGRVVQTGRLSEITAEPRSDYVAELVGTNLFRGTAGPGRLVLATGDALAAVTSVRGEAFAVVHPRAVALHSHRPDGSPRNIWPGTVEHLDLMGDRVRVAVAGPVPIVSEVTPAALAELALGHGTPVWVSVKATEIVVYPT